MVYSTGDLLLWIGVLHDHKAIAVTACLYAHGGVLLHAWAAMWSISCICSAAVGKTLNPARQQGDGGVSELSA